MTTYLDYLPVELLDMIFQYLSHCDIIWSFSNLSPYLNSVLNNYNSFEFNFQSISKYRFDFICQHLDIEQILSLTLSDGLTTPGQVQLFFTRFHLRDFIHLHSLTLLSITNDGISPLLSDLPKLKYLKSLITECRSSQPLLLGQILNQLKSLEHLSVSQGDIFDHNVAFPLHHLKVLDAGMCNFLELRRLQMIVPSLISLKIHLQANHQLQLLSDSNIWSSLERLDLTLNDETITITFNEMQEFLLHFHHLRYLTLNIRGLSDYLADGNRWEMCSTIVHLRKFHFMIEFDDAPINPNRATQQILKSFSTPFWQELKKWYIAITPHQIYTISCFNNQLFIPSTTPPLCTSPDDRWFYTKVKRIKMEKNNSSMNLTQFDHLERLDLAEENLLLSIDHLTQFTRLRRLIFHQPISNVILGDILKQNPHIDHLTVSQNDFKQLFPLKTIHYLHFEDSIKMTSRTQIRELCRVFPWVKKLLIHLHSRRLISPLIDNLYRLENAVFHFQELTKPISPEWLKENTRLDEKAYSFTCRSESNRFLLWISTSVIPTIPLKEKIAETFDLVQTQPADKCSLQ